MPTWSGIAVAGFGAAMIAARILRIAATRTLKSVQAATVASSAEPAAKA
jgi:hypothetical protein